MIIELILLSLMVVIVPFLIARWYSVSVPKPTTETPMPDVKPPAQPVSLIEAIPRMESDELCTIMKHIIAELDRREGAGL
jgi:hypothetical protein